MEKVHDSIAWYQKQIGSYDKQLWEQSVENKLLKAPANVRHAPRKSVRLKTEFIDVDLIRGSTFSKSKPQAPWSYITRKAFIRVFLLPFCYRWWIQQTSCCFFTLLLLLYSLQILTIAIYCSNVGDAIVQDELTISEVFFPIIITIILGLIHSQTVLSHYSHKPPNRDKHQRNLSKSKRRNKENGEVRNSASNTQVNSSRNDALFRTANSSPSQTSGATVSSTSLPSRSDLNLRDKNLTESQESDVREPVMTLRGENPSSQVSSGAENSDMTGCDTANTQGNEKGNEGRSASASRSDLHLMNKSAILKAKRKKRVQLRDNGDALIQAFEEGQRKSNLIDSEEGLLGSEDCDGSFDDPMDALVDDILDNENEIESIILNDSSINLCNEASNKVENISRRPPVMSLRRRFTSLPSEDLGEVTDNECPEDELEDSHNLHERRRFNSTRSVDLGEVTRTRSLPSTLPFVSKPSLRAQISSNIQDLTPDTHRAVNGISAEEWEDRITSDLATSSSYSSSCESANGLSDNEEAGLPQDLIDVQQGWASSSINAINLLQPPTTSNVGFIPIAPPDKVSCVIWEGNECKKVDLTALDIGWAIIDKVDNLPESSDYIMIGFCFSILIGCVPIVFRIYHTKELPGLFTYNFLIKCLHVLFHHSWRRNFLMLNGIIQRFCLSLIFFFLLSVADRTFKQRLLYAKHFCYLTSSRRARKFDMPHFRLSKVRNIKTWLSLRSYLKRRGPQRSVDVIVSATFLTAVSLVSLMCLQMLKDTDVYLDFLCNWELIVWCLCLGVYLLRFMTLGLKINKKYRNLSVLITEQINLYLQMEQKPHKKEELILANNVLKLAEDLLKELESPFKISGFSANPFIYNVTKVVVLSAFSTVLTELLGFKLKLYKIKFKA